MVALVRGALLLAMALTLNVPAAVIAHAAEGEITIVAGTPGEGLATAIAQSASDVAVVGDRLIVADALFGAVREIDLHSGAQLALHQPDVVTPPGRGYGRMPFPQTLAAAPDGSVIVGQQSAHRVIRMFDDGRTEVVAGTGAWGRRGDDGRATEAFLTEPHGVAVDPDGAIYIADTGNHVIRRVDPSGIITTIAGTGERGYSGDGGQATQAKLDTPMGLAAAADGSVYVVDAGNARVRRVDRLGTITTVAGRTPGTNGGDAERCADRPADSVQVHGSNAVAVDAGGRLHLIGGLGGCVYRLEGDGRATWIAGRDGGPGGRLEPVDAKDAFFDDVGGMTFGSDGSLYLADVLQAVVHRIDPAGVVTTVAGSPQPVVEAGTGHQWLAVRHGSSGDRAPARFAQLAHITGMTADASGAVYLTEAMDYLLRRIEPDGIVVRSVAGDDLVSNRGDGGPALGAYLARPIDVAAGPDGSLYVAEYQHVRRIDPSGIITTIAGLVDGPWPCGETEGRPAYNTLFPEPSALAVGPDGLLYVGEWLSGRIRRIERDGTITTIAGDSYESCPYTGVSSPTPGVTGLAVAGDGTVYATNGTCLYRIEARHRAACLHELTSREAEAVDPELDDQDDPPSRWRSGSSSADLRSDVEVDADGSVLVSDPWGDQVLRWRDDSIEVVAGSGERAPAVGGRPATRSPLAMPTALAVSPGGSIHVYEAGTHRIVRVDGEVLPSPVTRLGGTDRIATSVEASRDDLPRLGADGAVLARADEFADALAGTPLAAWVDGPLLLTGSDRLDGRVEAELRRTVPQGRTVYLLGGASALGPDVEARVRHLGYRPVRLAGPDRFATAVAIAEHLPSPTTVLITTGTDFADALSAGAAAARVRGAVVLTAGDQLPAATATYLSRSTAPQVAVGGPAARALPGTEAVRGRTRYETATAVADRFFPQTSQVVVASGERFPDALSAGARAARAGAPLLLTPAAELGDTTAAWISARRERLHHAYISGGEAAVSARARVGLSGTLR